MLVLAMCQANRIDIGLPILQQAYTAGQRAGFPGVEQVAELINYYTNQATADGDSQ